MSDLTDNFEKWLNSLTDEQRKDLYEELDKWNSVGPLASDFVKEKEKEMEKDKK